MNTKLLESLNAIQSRFTGLFNADEKALLLDIRKHANSDELTLIDDLLTCDFDIDNNGYTYCFAEELIREIKSDRFEDDRGFAGFYSAYLKFVDVNAENGENVNTQPLDEADMSMPVLYATHRLIDSVWTCAYMLTDKEHEVIIVSYGRNINAGYKYEHTLPKVKVIESEDGKRTIEQIEVDGVKYQVANPARVFSYNSSFVLSSEINKAARELLVEGK